MNTSFGTLLCFYRFWRRYLSVLIGYLILLLVINFLKSNLFSQFAVNRQICILFLITNQVFISRWFFGGLYRQLQRELSANVLRWNFIPFIYFRFLDSFSGANHPSHIFEVFFKILTLKLLWHEGRGVCPCILLTWSFSTVSLRAVLGDLVSQTNQRWIGIATVFVSWILSVKTLFLGVFLNHFLVRIR